MKYIQLSASFGKQSLLGLATLIKVRDDGSNVIMLFHKTKTYKCHYGIDSDCEIYYFEDIDLTIGVIDNIYMFSKGESDFAETSCRSLISKFC